MTPTVKEENRLITCGRSVNEILSKRFPKKKGVVGLMDIVNDPEVKTLLSRSNEILGVLGYTEHGFRHSSVTAYRAGLILEKLEYPPRICELSAIGGYLHDIGNIINREYHELSSAMLAGNILPRLNMQAKEYVEIMIACGNHDEDTGEPVTEIGASVIIADKSDVHRTRVRNPSMVSFDIHDRVNYAVEETYLSIDKEKMEIQLHLIIDTAISQVMEYFEIFTTRMSMCRKAARKLNCDFSLIINDNKLS
jgi:hypothetical protein